MKLLKVFILLSIIPFFTSACGGVSDKAMVGLSAPDFSLQDRQGNTWTLSELKGQVVFVNFWATWCPPCVAEMPDLQHLHNAFGDKVQFFFIARDKKDRVSKFMTKNNYDLPVYFEAGFTPKTLYSPALPTTFIVDAKGNIVIAETGSADWNDESIHQLLENLLKQK